MYVKKHFKTAAEAAVQFKNPVFSLEPDFKAGLKLGHKSDSGLWSGDWLALPAGRL